jgi:glucokinase
MKLVGDVGGTKVLLALAAADGTLVEKRRLPSADFQGFDELLAAYLRDVAAPLDGGCLAVAGPVADDSRRARLTNLPWTIDAAALEARFGLGPLVLINDFAGVALGIAALAPERRVTLQAGEPLAAAPRLVVGAGTGLGMAVLLPEGKRWRVLPGEGGNTAFAPADAQQAALWTWLHARKGRVIWEDVVSGPGLANIHRFFGGGELTPEEIAAAAVGGAAAAGAAIELFLSCYGAYAGDMALALLPRGGVYLAGGIAAKLLPQLRAGAFLAAFNAKERHACVTARMPVCVVTDEEAGLAGAALQALDAVVDYSQQAAISAVYK